MQVTIRVAATAGQSLCTSFGQLARATYRDLEQGEQVRHQLLEETITDVNILRLKVRHPTEIKSIVFSKRREGITGADWEWWLTDRSRGTWLGIRVQAKVLQLSSDSFPHLHFRSGSPPEFQLERLKRDAAKNGLVPLYCFYLRLKSPLPALASGCQGVSYAPEEYGCSLASVSHVEHLRKTKSNDLRSVLAAALPWQCLVCCSDSGADDLPVRAWRWLQGQLRVNVADPIAPAIGAGPRDRPPQYVQALLQQELSTEEGPENVAGIVIIAPRRPE